MNDIIGLVSALIAGLLLGGIFFFGLWWTVKRGVISKHPALLFLSSILLRTAIVLLGFYFVIEGSFIRLVTCLLGFFVSRIIVRVMTRVKPHKQGAENGGNS